MQRLPQYCPPVEKCQHARLAGADCRPSMGILEPFVCPSGKYCPPPGLVQLNCTSGHFCPRGSIKPLKCSFGASCGENAKKNQTFFPLGLLGILDLALILWLLWVKLFAKNSAPTMQRKRWAGSGHFLKRAATMVEKSQTEKRYYSLSDEEIHLESRISSVKRENTGFLAVIDNDYAFDNGNPISSHVMDEKSNKDLNAFVSSLSSCVNTNTFGLSFEFENLNFVSFFCVHLQTRLILNVVP